MSILALPIVFMEAKGNPNDDDNPFARQHHNETQIPLVRNAWDMVKFAKLAIDRGEEVEPMMHMILPDREAVARIGGLFTPQTDSMRPAMLSLMLERLGATAYVLVTEVWSLELAPGEPRPHHRNEDDPRRESGLMIRGATKVGDIMELTFSIDETKGRAISQKSFNVWDPGDCPEKGPMVNLFHKVPKVDDDVVFLQGGHRVN